MCVCVCVCVSEREREREPTSRTWHPRVWTQRVVSSARYHRVSPTEPCREFACAFPQRWPHVPQLFFPREPAQPRMHTSAYVSIRQHTSACAMRQHTSAYVSIPAGRGQACVSDSSRPPAAPLMAMCAKMSVALYRVAEALVAVLDDLVASLRGGSRAEPTAEAPALVRGHVYSSMRTRI